jgi:CBS domain-containing protein
VKRNERVLGLVTPREVRTIERARWHDVTVGDVMRPIETLTTVEPKTPVTDALRAMVRDDVGQLPVVSDGRLQGVITRGHILDLMQSRQELKAA